jgi:hypothetical protein
MRLKPFAFSALALLLGALGPGLAGAAAQAPGPGYGQARGWDMPPREFNALQRQGFQDGLEGARRDADNHRNPNPENRDEYRNPHMPPEQATAYRDGFRRGYQVGVSHFYGAPGRPGMAPVPPPPPAWDFVPNEFNDIQRQGFHDGMEGARRDADNHRPPNPNNRDEYRHPNVPRELRHAYREAFRQGYNRAVQHMMGGDRDHDRDHGPY